jgi:hypothetical protein
MKRAILLALVLVGGCGVGTDIDEQSSEITGRGTVVTGRVEMGAFNTLTINGNSVKGQMCLTDGCGTTASITGRGTVVTGRLTAIAFNKSGHVSAACQRLSSLGDGADVEVPVTDLSTAQLVLQNVCDGSTYSLTAP